MKTSLLLCGLLLIAMSHSHAEAQFSPGPRKTAYTTEQWRTRRIQAAKHIPLRIAGGKLYDLTDEILSGAKTVSGKVLQVISEGLLVMDRDTFKVLLLVNHPAQEAAVDGQRIDCFAVRTGGRHQYENTQGATKTVPILDYGSPFAGSGKKFDTVVRCWANGERSVVKFEP